MQELRHLLRGGFDAARQLLFFGPDPKGRSRHGFFRHHRSRFADCAG